MTRLLESPAEFASIDLPAERTAIAPDGSDVRVLLGLARGGMAHFELAAGTAAAPVVHRTVEEIWFVLSGRGDIWRRQGAHEQVVALEPVRCITIPLGTHFQFRAHGDAPLSIVAVTMPPWPGDGEALPVTSPWPATCMAARLSIEGPSP